MQKYTRYLLGLLVSASVTFLFSFQAFALSESIAPVPLEQLSVKELGKNLQVGDIVFIHVKVLPFEKISNATQSWVNHVGIVVDISDSDPLIAESSFPISQTTKLSRFAARSKEGRMAIARLHKPLTEQQRQAVWDAAQKRLNVFYDTGFDLHSSRQFCSRFVREVLAEAVGIHVGEVETFERLFKTNPQADLFFWRVWFMGNIPWERKTVTPASVFDSEHLKILFDGVASK